MSSTPKWYCRNKSQPMHTFAEITQLSDELRRITKRIIIDVKVDIYSEHDTILEECEKIVELYWSLKDESKNKDFLSLSKKIKRSPYNALLIQKYNNIMALNDRRFCQLTFVLKRTLTYLLRKSMQSEMWLNWALQITHLYNKCRCNRLLADGVEVAKETPPPQQQLQQQDNELNANICSNMYPALLLPFKSIDFAYVLHNVSQMRIEQNSLDLIFGLFNMGEQDAWRERDKCESNSSSLEILRILNLNNASDSEYQRAEYYDTPQHDYRGISGAQLTAVNEGGGTPSSHGDINQSLRSKHTEYFLQKERAFLAQFIDKAKEICPTIFGSGHVDFNAFIVRGIRLIWSYVGIILDHVILWWIETIPISCYSMTHVDSIRHWLYMQNINDIPEPVYSTLRGIGEILTNFVCNNIWDHLFRLTLISATCSSGVVENSMEQYRGSPKNQYGTPTGTVWITVFSNLINLSNNYFPNNEVHHSSSLPIAEQIPILHRIDHSVHSMRIWVKEQAKMLCCIWRMDRFFQILEHDVKICLESFVTLKLPKLTADLTDILMLVCVALRTKLICEINVNIDKLKKTTDECVQILSAVCRILSLANFTLSFPSAPYWQQNVYDTDTNSSYVGYVLDQIYLPTIKATHDINILKLILKIVCEAWLDYIYKKRIKFSVNGAVRLLGDFDNVREWILNCSILDAEFAEKLSNHEVLRMCKGVGKILLRKPEDVISITQSPRYDKRGPDAGAPQETQLPSEMFVSNQKHWLQLRASQSNFPFLNFCCGDAML